MRNAAIAPLMARLDALDETTAQRLDELSKRVHELETAVQIVEGRSATVTERSVTQQESVVRLARRVDEIEKLLSER
ncbi:MAG TPA: hypothetical protein VFH58_12245 [Acidimicrobiales bacterium]|nr:hypothetical protein [Acidimicrobiales bacterium]